MKGLDVNIHYSDIVRIVKSRFSCEVSDIDDLIHDVCLKILNLNQTSPFDPNKSSLSNYIYLVASSLVVSEKRRKGAKRRCPGYLIPESCSSSSGMPYDIREFDLMDSYLKILDDHETAISILDLLTKGFTTREVRNKLGLTEYRFSKESCILKDSYLSLNS
jgi:DNA-directed RNA polymerase specialized sigma24 family protein